MLHLSWDANHWCNIRKLEKYQCSRHISVVGFLTYNCIDQTIYLICRPNIHETNNCKNTHNWFIFSCNLFLNFSWKEKRKKKCNFHSKESKASHPWACRKWSQTHLFSDPKHHSSKATNKINCTSNLRILRWSNWYKMWRHTHTDIYIYIYIYIGVRMLV
jgi:hypothetical protein